MHQNNEQQSTVRGIHVRTPVTLYTVVSRQHNFRDLCSSGSSKFLSTRQDRRRETVHDLE